jgi:superfamily I DNA/RNA helicase
MTTNTIPVSAPSLLAGLTAAQRQVATHPGGPLLVVAGPGAGKTRTLTARLQYLLEEQGVDPAGLLAVTFTRKAAAELQTRLAAALGERAAAITVGTFHRVALLLRPQPPGTALLGEGDRLLFCERALAQGAASARAPGRAGRLAQLLSLLKGLRSDWEAAVRSQEPAVRTLLGRDADELGAAALRYQGLLAAYQAEDLDDLLLHALAALRAGTAERTFRHVAIDEYQDVNGVQRELAVALGRDAAEVLAIGDPDQAIYAFRGAEVAHFHAFPADFPDARQVALRENFRSCENLVAASAAVIAQAVGDRPDAPVAVRPAGPPIVRWTAPTLTAEALLIVREVERLIGGTSLLSHDARRAAAWAGASYGFSDIAVLTRTSARADQLAAALQQEGVPIQRPRRAHLDSEAARELAAYLRLSARPGDPGADLGALWRVLRCEARLRGLAFADELLLPKAAGSRLDELPAPLVAAVHERLATLGPLPVRERLAALTVLLATPEADAAAVAAQLAQLAPQQLALADDSHESDEWEKNEERVAVLTLHGAKGLEFPVVFLAGCEAELLPGRSRAPAEVEEERRLFYVGLTRAQDRLYVSCISAAGSRVVPKATATAAAAGAAQPSPFLDELPGHLVEQPAPPKRKPPPPQLKLFR